MRNCWLNGSPGYPLSHENRQGVIIPSKPLQWLFKWLLTMLFLCVTHVKCSHRTRKNINSPWNLDENMVKPWWIHIKSRWKNITKPTTKPTAAPSPPAGPHRAPAWDPRISPAKLEASGNCPARYHLKGAWNMSEMGTCPRVFPVKMVMFLVKMVIENGDFPGKNCYFPSKNCDSPLFFVCLPACDRKSVIRAWLDEAEPNQVVKFRWWKVWLDGIWSIARANFQWLVPSGKL